MNDLQYYDMRMQRDLEQLKVIRLEAENARLRDALTDAIHGINNCMGEWCVAQPAYMPEDMAELFYVKADIRAALEAK